MSCDAAFAEIELARCVIICASAEIAHCTEYNTKLNGAPIAGTSRPLRSTTSRAVIPRSPNIQDKKRLDVWATKHAIHLSVNYLSNASARRNCHISSLRFDSYQKYFFDHELYQFLDTVIRSQKTPI
jgi:hypothetical protein